MELDDILKYCKRFRIYYYAISPDGVVDVFDHVAFHCEDTTLGGFQFGSVEGDFYISYVKLTSLVGCPITIGGSFYAEFVAIKACVENYEILYRYDYDKITISPVIMIEYTKYYKARKRVETINDILNQK